MSCRSDGVRMPEATEDVEQMNLFRWAGYQVGRWPELSMLLHIPNGGKRGKAEAARFKQMGVKAGVPDIFLPAPRGGLHGLFIELKRERSGRLSHEQAEWLEALTREGYQAAVCHGWEQAARVIEGYMEGGREAVRGERREEGCRGTVEGAGRRRG